jgi:pilus assembly protein CpaE
MLRGILICPDSELSTSLESLTEQTEHLTIVRKLEQYPPAVELARHLRAQAPHVVFLSIEVLGKAVEAIDAIESAVPGIQVVVISRSSDPQTLLELMRKGVREFLSAPFRRSELYETIGRLRENADKRPPAYFTTNLLFTFLPSKPGVGTSTVAMNATAAASKLPDTKCILVDFDLNNGLQRFMLKLHNEYCVTDAAEYSFNLDENIWPQLVTPVGQMEVLHAGKVNPSFRIEATQVRHLVEYMRRAYKLISIDLSGNMEKHSIELMQESKKIFLVCTPEITSLHLAREKLTYLRTLDLGDRVNVLLNRAQKRAVIAPAQVEELLSVPVMITLPNDYQGVHRALQAGKPVDTNSELGKQFSKLAMGLLEKQYTQPAEPKKRLVEYLSMFPSKPTTFADVKKSVS